MTNLLTWWQWAIVAAAPLAVVLLYFLKLKRQPLEVPSTFLWRKSIEDLHVNSFWQRLRSSLLLWLQLLLLALVILALVNFNWRGSELPGDRFVFLIDASASMAAVDVEPSRLAAAKARVGELIDAMKSGDVAMLVSFSDAARVEQPFTDNRQELRRRLEAIEQTDRPTDIREALQVAAGRANPGRVANEKGDVPTADAVPATVYIVSDGRFEGTADFAWGVLTPVYVPIGRPQATNVAITAFEYRRHDERPDRAQAFGRIENFAADKIDVEAQLFLNDRLLDTQSATIAPGQAGGVEFALTDIDAGVLKLVLATDDALPLDNTAWAVVDQPRRARVALITGGNAPLRTALETDRDAVELTVAPPAIVDDAKHRAAAAAGEFDLVIYDRCQPKEMPAANTLFIARLPPVAPGAEKTPAAPAGADSKPTWRQDAAVASPQIIDTDLAHPLMNLIRMGPDILIAEGTPVHPPAGGAVLIESTAGPLLAIAPRETFQDAVLGFELVSGDGLGTNWLLRLSFPVFVRNVLSHLAGGLDPLSGGANRPGQAATIRLSSGAEQLFVRCPRETEPAVAPRAGPGAYAFTRTERVGVYAVYEDRAAAEAAPADDFAAGRALAVNLFDPRESSLAARPEESLVIGNVAIEPAGATRPVRRDLWKYFVLASLAVLVGEWYIYNRRMYV